MTKITMNVKLQVTISQAVAMKEMFERWNFLSNIGSSRHVSFFVDGDGNFHPKVEITFSEGMPDFTEEQKEIIKQRAANENTEIVKIEKGNKFDFDNIGWYLRSIGKHD